MTEYSQQKKRYIYGKRANLVEALADVFVIIYKTKKRSTNVAVTPNGKPCTDNGDTRLRISSMFCAVRTRTMIETQLLQCTQQALLEQIHTTYTTSNKAQGEEQQEQQARCRC